MNVVARRPGAVGSWLHRQVLEWRSGTRASQVTATLVLVAVIGLSLALSIHDYALMPIAAYFFYLFVAMIVLRFWPLVVVSAAATLAGVLSVELGASPTLARTMAAGILVASALLVIFQASLQRTGLPSVLGQAMLADLRDRLQRQSRVPVLPTGWRCETSMVSAGGSGYAGDFLVAELSEDQRHLEMVLVDVCGKGVSAATQSLQFAGALGGLIGALPPQALMASANDFLLRQDGEDALATAVHVLLNLRTGAYEVTSAGHPPALRWCSKESRWEIDPARGLALGVARRPEFHRSTGVLEPGEALAFYTDGVVETRDRSLTDGIAWLQDAAGRAVEPGFEGAAARLMQRVPRGDDDRAVLVLWRDPA
ncbi:PP2C family protein-serine/threonine phosphatase [Aeromicrobium massiliense]|uniref:PP2C family protein-serine/threonine phosphatase n=1 Tax=Aeromicrobium massiliense TaxID=1464554 RepID=UPI0002FE58BE|nr:PP2C family protein-serine/threonine phosphatase [Aeromicrobium massiliense]